MICQEGSRLGSQLTPRVGDSSGVDEQRVDESNIDVPLGLDIPSLSDQSFLKKMMTNWRMPGMLQP